MQHVGAGIRRPHLDDVRTHEPDGGGGDGAQHGIGIERRGHHLLELRELAQPAGTPPRIGIEPRVLQRQRASLREQRQHRHLVVRERTLHPRMHGKGATDDAFDEQRRRRHGLESLARDVTPSHGIELPAGIRKDVGRCDGTGLDHGDAHRPPRERNAARRVLAGQTARGAQHVERFGAPVPGRHHRRVRAHDFARRGHDRVEHLVELEGRRERAADGLEGTHERRALPLLGDVAQDQQGAGRIRARRPLRLEPDGGGAEIDRSGRPAPPLARKRKHDRPIPEGGRKRGEHVLDGAPERAGALGPREPLHGRVARDDEVGVVDHDDSIVEAVDDAGVHVRPHAAPSIQPRSARTVGICLADLPLGVSFH